MCVINILDINATSCVNHKELKNITLNKRERSHRYNLENNVANGNFNWKKSFKKNFTYRYLGNSPKD